MRIAPQTLTLAGLILTLAACGGGGTTGTGGAGTGGAGAGGASPDGGITAAQACADSATAQCDKRDACSSGLGTTRSFGGPAVCQMRLAAECVANAGAKGSSGSPAHTEQCALAYASEETCTDYQESIPDCATLPGTLADGAPCGTNGQCSSTFCAVSSTEVCGTCQPLPPAGAACHVAADCAHGFACAIPTGATLGACTAYVPAGGPCLTGTTVCGANLACVGDDEAAATMGTCMTAGSTVGAACDTTRQTLPNCADYLGLSCIPSAKDSTVGACQDTTFVQAGATCGPLGSAPPTGYAECTDGATCIKATGSATGVCTAPAADGAACDSDPTKGPPCLSPSKCVPTGSTSTVGTCTPAGAAQCL